MHIRLTKKMQVITIAVLFLLVSFSVSFLETSSAKPMKKEQAPVIEVLGPKTVEVVLLRKYVDGEISEEIKEETIWSMEDFWAAYQGWNLVDQNESRMLFEKQIDDISPLLKLNGYFGISEDGVLHIYEGSPGEEKVIQSFFQINTKQLKSHEQNKLKKGIPVISRENYQEVLSLYKKYQMTEM